MTQPSVGRIVHYVTPGGEYKSECRAAIITGGEPYGCGPCRTQPDRHVL